MYGQGLWMVIHGLKNNDIVVIKGNTRIDPGQTLVIDKQKGN